MTTMAFASDVKGPWIFTTERTIIRRDVPEGVLLLELDAASMTNLEELYLEFAAVFRFPDYFGKNLAALDECITDLEWLPADAYLLVIKNTGSLLKHEPNDVLKSQLLTLVSAGIEWATPVSQSEVWDRTGVPFHTILELKEGEVSGFQLKLKTLGLEIENL